MAKHARGAPLRWSNRGGRRVGSRVGEALVAVFGLGVLLFSPLVMTIFDRGGDVTVFGIPLLYAFLLAAWLLLIVLIAWVMESQADESRGRRQVVPGRRPPPDRKDGAA